MKLCPECFAEYADDVTSCPIDGLTLSGLDGDPLLGTKLSDRYEILEVIGRGGMGVVYKGRHETMDRFVAIKMLHAHLVSDAEAIKRFHREAKAVSRVKHPHTVALYDFGITPTGQPYIVMDFIDGYSLKRVIKQEGALSLERAEHIFQQVVDALSCAHTEGVVHRDLKPENIMLTRRGSDGEWVEIVDFGISKLKSKDTQQTYNITRVGDVCGSPPYMSPEQCLGSVPVDARSDVYALGIVVYEALVGRLPFKAKSAIEMIDCHMYAPPAPLKAVSPELACCDALNTMLMKALQKEPERRQQSMPEFGSELREAIKRDSVKMASWRNRPDAVTGSADQVAQPDSVNESQKPKPENTRVLTADRAPQVRTGPDVAGGTVNPQPFMTRITDTLMNLLGRKRDRASHAGGYTPTNCPFCSASMDPQIKFCLDCGRNVTSADDMAKLRSIQGVFTIPKVHTGDHAQLEFSSRTKKALSKSGGIFGVPRIVILMNLILIIVICALYLAHDRELSASRSGLKALVKTQGSDKGHKLVESHKAHSGHRQ